MTFVRTKEFGSPVFNAVLNNLFADSTVGTSLKKAHNFISNAGVAVNVKETTDTFLLELVAPGRTKGDFTLNLKDNHLIVASKVVEEEGSSEKFFRKEFTLADFKKSFKLPESVDKEAISAVYEEGILKLTLAKREDAKPINRAIEVI